MRCCKGSSWCQSYTQLLSSACLLLIQESTIWSLLTHTATNSRRTWSNFFFKLISPQMLLKMSSGFSMILYTLVVQTDENIKITLPKIQREQIQQAHEFQVCHAPKQTVNSLLILLNYRWLQMYYIYENGITSIQWLILFEYSYFPWMPNSTKIHHRILFSHPLGLEIT